MAGLKRKERDFWKYIEKLCGNDRDYLGRLKRMGKNKKEIPKGFNWNCQGAKRENKRGRARGGIITGIKGGWEIEGIKETKETNGLVDR